MGAEIRGHSTAIEAKRGTNSEVWEFARLGKTVDRQPMEIQNFGELRRGQRAVETLKLFWNAG